MLDGFFFLGAQKFHLKLSRYWSFMNEWAYCILRLESLAFGNFLVAISLNVDFYYICSILSFPSFWNVCICLPCLLSFLIQVYIFAEKQRTMHDQFLTFFKIVVQKDNGYSVCFFIPWGFRDSRKYSYFLPLLVHNQPTISHKMCTLYFIVISISSNSFSFAHCFSSVAAYSWF